MRPSAKPRNSNWRLGSCAAFVIAVIALHCAPLQAEAQLLQPLGPRSLYPRVNHFTNNVEFTPSMRDALQYRALGTRLLAVGPRIMGGEPAPFGAWPWIASLELKLQRRRDAHFCGGAFIAPQWVITAAHCVKPASAGAIDVLGGTNTLETGGALYPVDRVIVHEKYDTDTQDYDVALLHLSRAYPGKTVRLLTGVDAERYAAVGGYAISAGWGLTAEGAEVSNILRQVTVQIVSNETCNGVAAYSGAVTDRMMCAGFPEGGKDSCQGDSGGPLMVSDLQGGYFQAGIVSWGEGCGRPNKFGVYTRVSTIAGWVADKIGSKAAPVASNAAPKAAKTELNKTESNKAEPAKPAKAKTANTAPSTSPRFGDAAPTPTLRAPAVPAVSSVPLPQPRPSALETHKKSPRLRSGRRMGVPIDRKYSPANPARAQSRRGYDTAPRRQPGRYYYVAPHDGTRGYYLYTPPDRSRVVIPPSFDWRVPR